MLDLRFKAFYSLVDKVFWLIDLQRETQTRLSEDRLKEILQKSERPGNLEEVKNHPNHLFYV